MVSTSLGVPAGDSDLFLNLSPLLYEHRRIDYLSVTDLAASKLFEFLLATIQDESDTKSFCDSELATTDFSTDKVLNSYHSKSKIVGVRLALPTKGCGGLSYQIEYLYDSHVNPLDEVLEIGNGVRIFVDPLKSLMLFGMQLDYEDNGMEYGFKFINPNEGGRCGCGSSFYFDK